MRLRGTFLTSSGIRDAIRSAAAVVAVPFVLGFPDPAHAQGKLDARYDFTLAGVSVGRGSWVIDIGDEHFTASASGQTAGLMRVLAGGRGQSTARGAIVGGQFVPATYRSNIFTDKRYDEVRMAISGGVVREFVVEPPALPMPNRVPITEAHRRGVVDPMSASLFRIPGTGSLFTPEACPRKLSIFDGRMRYDLHLTFKRIDKVKAEKGYQGNAVVCSVIFSPIAGHVPDRALYPVSGQPTRDRSVARADRRNPRPGALPGGGPDPDRNRRHAGHPVRLGPAARQAKHVGQGPMKLSRSLATPSFVH